MRNVSIITLLFLAYQIINAQTVVNTDTVPVQVNLEKEIIPIENPSSDFYHNIWDNTNIKYNIDKKTFVNDTLVVSIDSTDTFCFPLPYIGRFLSPFGPRRRRMHTGTDLKCNSKDSLFAVFGGKVRIARKCQGYGNMVVIRHKSGLETLYGHLSIILVKPDDIVKAGDLIGLGGRTGRATTEHLHFETRILGIPFDSEKYINFSTGKLTANKLYFLNNEIEINPDNFEKYLQNNAPELECGFDGEVGSQPLLILVKSGDNLYKLSKKYDTPIDSIMKRNNLKKGAKLSIGQQLRIK